MSVLDINSFPLIKRKLTDKPDGDIIPISWWQPDVVEVQMCCVDCLWRWTEIVPVTMTRLPEWMGNYNCPAADCKAEGSAVRA